MHRPRPITINVRKRLFVPGKVPGDDESVVGEVNGYCARTEEFGDSPEWHGGVVVVGEGLNFGGEGAEVAFWGYVEVEWGSEDCCGAGSVTGENVDGDDCEVVLFFPGGGGMCR